MTTMKEEAKKEEQIRIQALDEKIEKINLELNKGLPIYSQSIWYYRKNDKSKKRLCKNLEKRA